MSTFRTALASIWKTRAIVIPIAVLGVFGASAPSEAATRFVATTGTDGAACEQLAPCASFARAYAVAQSGDVIQVAGGVYPSQSVGGSKSVTFRGLPGATVRQMINDASNVTYDGINVDAGGTKTTGAAFEFGGSNATVRNASVGNVVDEKTMLATGSNLTVDNVVFHDAIYRTDGTHMECLYAIGVPGFTIRNSTFRDCAVMDLFFTYGSWWSPLPPTYGNVTIENNVFSHPEMENNAGWHYYGLYIASIGPNGAADPMSGWVVRNNTFENDVLIAPDSGSNGTRWVGNIGAWDCKPGIAFRYNVGDKCGATDKRVSPAASTATSTARIGYLDPGGYDFRLKAGSPAIDAGDPADAPLTDRRGWARDARPDAGAYEFGATGPPGAPGSGGPGGSPSAKRALRLQLARLSRRTICVRRTRRCPSVARLRLRVSAPARVSVRVQRLRKGRKPRKVLSFARQVRVKRTLKLRARRLGRGRYRVIVSARNSAGLRAKSKRLKLRVR